MKKISLFLLAAISLFLFSCKKDSSDNNQTTGDIKGTWNVVNFDMEGNSSSEISSPDLGSLKAVFDFDYLSENHTGTLTIDDVNMTSKDLAYDINGTINIKQYFDGSLVSSEDSTFAISMSPSSSTTAYTRIGSDSLYCPNGSFITMEGENMTSKPVGIKYRFDGNKMIWTVTQKTSEIETQDGVTQDDRTDIKMIATFQKP